MHVDFKQVDGTIVTDAVGGIAAKLIGAAKVERVGKYQVLNLGNNSGYLNLTAAAGVLLKSMNDFTISACYRIDARLPTPRPQGAIWLTASMHSAWQRLRQDGALRAVWRWAALPTKVIGHTCSTAKVARMVNSG